MDIAVHVQLLGKLDFQGISIVFKGKCFRLTLILAGFHIRPNFDKKVYNAFIKEGYTKIQRSRS